MANTESPFQLAIEELEKELEEMERNASALRATINLLRSKANLPSLSESAGNGHGSEGATATTGILGQIRPDTFYGKKMGTAAREYLEMRKARNQGPAKPKEIHQAMVAGGFQFDTKDEVVAMVSLRAMLRKNTVMFHKLPNGAYGLRSWYQHVRPSKASSDDDGEK
jgi:uncharacterized phage protein gp47/JayE